MSRAGLWLGNSSVAADGDLAVRSDLDRDMEDTADHASAGIHLLLSNSGVGHGQMTIDNKVVSVASSHLEAADTAAGP